VTHVHVKLTSPLAQAEAQPRDFAAQLEALRQTGYEGDFSLEYEGPGPAQAGLVAGVQLLRQIWGDGPPLAEVG
jgi:sugar phosphate isomerase/epimerase